MIRRIFYAIIFSLTAYFVIRHFDELKLILETVGSSDGRWLLVAVVVQFVWLVMIAANLQSTYRLIGIDETLTRLVPLTAAANFINAVAPSYGLGAMAVFITDGQQRGKPAGKVSTASFLYLVYDYAGFMIVLALGFIVFIQRDMLTPVLLGAAIFAVSVGVTLIILTIAGVLSADRMERSLVGLTDLGNRLMRPFSKRPLLDRSKSSALGRQMTEGLKEIRHSPRSLVVPGIFALLRKTVMALVLYLVSVAFHNPFDLGTLVATFAVSYLFTIASITPSGVGFVEGAMALTQTAMGVNPAISAGIALTYRGLTFWLVLLYGFIALRMVGYQPGEVKRDAQATRTLGPSPEDTASLPDGAMAGSSMPAPIPDRPDRRQTGGG